MRFPDKKLILIGIVLLNFIFPLQNGWTGSEAKKIHSNQIIHVGGIGNKNYSNIQDAINNASPGDTIYVHSGIYYENIFIGKKINLIGEHPLTTIIDGGEGIKGVKTDVIEIAADEVTISDFTIRNSIENASGIEVWAHYGGEKITNCIIYNNYYGIYLYLSHDNYVTNCTFYNNEYGVWHKCCCGRTCPDSLFYRNNFTNNIIHAFDQGTSKWDNGDIGNYWDDYTGKDENNDNIGDIPYNISGGANKDYHPFMHPIDTIPPLVELLFPNGGETLAGNVTIKWNVSDEHDSNPKIDIEYSNNGLTWNTIAEGLDNYGEYEWDTTSLPVGINYLIKITATDASGNKKSDISDAFTIILPPTLEVIRPLQGYLYIRNRETLDLPNNITICIGNINVAINASSEIGIKKVEFYVDDTLVETVIGKPYEWNWRMAFGKHNLKIIVYDSAENTRVTALQVWKFF